jgi:DNA-binding MarR family transcriptional regulator
VYPLQRVTQPADPTLVAIERAMLRIRRSVTRHELGKRMAHLVEAGELSQAMAVDAVDEASEDSPGGVTVGTVAERLGVDPSRASRLVAGAVRSGYLARVASQDDGRRILLQLTEAGRALAETMHAHRQGEFASAMRDWPERERREFARLLTRFTRA